MKFITVLPLLGSASAVWMPKDLDVQDTRSIRNVAATIAHDTMSYYQGNTTSEPRAIGNVNRPYYWWVAGALWGMMIDYYHVTQDPSYNQVVLDALLAKVNLGPENNYLPPEHADEEGNDDLFFWGNAVLTAAENNFPQPNKDLPSWLDISKNIFTWLVSRWDTKNCGGGVFWQILESNPNGLNYKNAISNGGFFQFAARLARATGDESYTKWAESIWEWSWNMHLIDHDLYRIYDGVDIRDGCQKVNGASYTYLSGIYLYGASVLANHTGKAEWSDRAEKLLDGAAWFFLTDDKSENVMYEGACEPVDSCFKGNADMSTFKGYLADLMWKSTVMLPSLHSKVADWLIPTAKAAAQSCQGGKSNTQCGMKWSTGGYDGQTNLGPQMNALGAVQGLLIDSAPPPMKAGDISRNYNANFAAVDPNRTDPTSTSTSTPTEKSTSETPTPTSTETPTPTTTTTTTTTSSDISTSTPAPTTTSSPTSEPTSTSETPTTTSSSSESTTFVTSTTPTPTRTETTTTSEIGETTTTENSELPTPTSCTSCTASESSTDITLTLTPTSEPSSSEPVITSAPGACTPFYTSSPSSHHSISTFLSMPNQSFPGTGMPASSSGLTPSIATLPSPTDESAATTGFTNHLSFAVAIAVGTVLVNWLA